jgi:hypothetical protein
MQTARAAFATLAIAAALAGAEVIDRIAVVTGDRVVTQNEIERELRTVALLNDKPFENNAATRRETAERLVEQSFIRREMEVSRYSPPSVADTNKLFEQTKKERFQTEEQYQAALQRYGVTEDEIRQHLEWQLMTLRFIDFRFRTGIQVPIEELREYYEQQFTADWRKKSSEAVPPFEEVRDDIEQILAEKRVDQALDRWMNQQRTQTRIRFQPEVFQ